MVVCLRVHVIVWGRGCGIGGGDAALRLSCCVSTSACSFRKKVCAVSPSELSTIGTSIGLQRTFGFTVDKVAKPKRLHLTNGCARCSGVDARPPKPHQACILPLGRPKQASLHHTTRRGEPRQTEYRRPPPPSVRRSCAPARTLRSRAHQTCHVLRAAFDASQTDHATKDSPPFPALQGRDNSGRLCLATCKQRGCARTRLS